MKKITRRDFLNDSSKAVLGAASAGLIFSTLKSSRVLGANERINIALIGCGGRGHYLGRGFIELAFRTLCNRII